MDNAFKSSTTNIIINNNTNNNNNNPDTFAHYGCGNRANVAATTTLLSDIDSYHRQQYDWVTNCPNSGIFTVQIRMHHSGRLISTTWQPSCSALWFKLRELTRRVCELASDDPITVKWQDLDGDYCTLSSDTEVLEMLRHRGHTCFFLSCSRMQDADMLDKNRQRKQRVNRDSQRPAKFDLYVFNGVPMIPGFLCDDEHVFRTSPRAAKRVQKIHVVGGHYYQIKRFTKSATCVVCQERVWGVASQGYQCMKCSMYVHKRCHQLVTRQCLNNRACSRWASAAFDEAQTMSSPQSAMWSSRSVTCLSPAADHRLHNHMMRWKHMNGSDREGSGVSSSCDESSNDISEIVSKNNIGYPTAIGAAERIVAIGGSASPSLPMGSGGHKVVCKRQAMKMHAMERVRHHPSFADYHLLRVIGRGSYAKVFLAQDKRAENLYAIKVIKKSMLLTHEGDVDWVKTERRVFNIATGHNFLVGLHSSFQTDRHLFLVIDYIGGGDLMFHMQRLGQLSEDHSRFYTSEIAIALTFLHSKGILYRDLKLDNVLIDLEGHIKLTDYGMCKEGLVPGQRTATFCGTPNYIAPEMLNSESYGPSVDWWALGVLTYEMLVGKSPFEINLGMTHNEDKNTEDYLFQQILQQPIRCPRFLSEKASSVIKGFLNKNPRKRLCCFTDDPLLNYSEMITHPFFRVMDFTLLERKAIEPPYQPLVSDRLDVSCFDPQFTDEPVELSPDTSQIDMEVSSTTANSPFNSWSFKHLQYMSPRSLTGSGSMLA